MITEQFKCGDRYKMIKIKNLSEVKSNKGDWIEREIVRDGAPYHVVVIPKAIIDEVLDCCQTYAHDNSFEDKPIRDENVDWILSIIAKATQERNGITLYEVESDRK